MFSNKRIKELEEEIERLKFQNSDLEQECKYLNNELELKRNEISALLNELTAIQKASEKNCKIGKYCKVCAFGEEITTKIDETYLVSMTYYACKYNGCNNFVKLN